MRLTNDAGVKMWATGEVAEFYKARGWQPAGESGAAQSADAAAESAKKRTTRRRKADNGVDATK